MSLTVGASLRALPTDINGSKPITFIPRATAAFATRIPIAPRPITPRVLPLISGPTN